MEPLKHHYIPEFYLKRWASPDDGKLCEWQRHRGVAKPRRVYPAQTGYVHRLYEMQDFPPNLAQQIETKFFQPVDTQAANALALMERDGTDTVWTNELRSAWTRFLLSLLLRCPEDLRKLRSIWKRDILVVPDEMEEKYQRLESDNDFPSFRSYIEGLPLHSHEKQFFKTFMSLVSSKTTGDFIINMNWAVLNLSSEFSIYTSDRPVIMTNGINNINGHILLPIGPTRLFLAASSKRTIAQADNADQNELAKQVNRAVIQHAVSYSYTQKDNCQRFVQNRMSTICQKRIVDRLGLTDIP